MKETGEVFYTIGTAGHVDHGKSALVRALTGVDPDRLPEEKARGMTIDLGFVHFDLGEGVAATFIDVPGHERFIRTTIAGVTGIDLVLFIVAADEGVMPQTREHKAILKYLGCRRGVVAITKKDLVDDEWLALVRSDLAAFFAGSFLECAPCVAVSATTGEGIDALKDEIRRVLLTVPARLTGGPFRMPIDRVFSMKGFGTVVAGTVASGSVRVKDELEIQPLSTRVRVRGIQSRNAARESIGVGARAALNVAGVEPDDVSRGFEITLPALLAPTRRLDLRLEVAAGAVRHRDRVRFNKGTAEALGRLLLLDADVAGEDDICFAQIVLEEPIVGVRFEPFVIRDASTLRLIGGGKIVDVYATPHRRQPWVIAELEKLAAAEGKPRDILRALFERRRGPRRAYDVAELAAITGLESDQLKASLREIENAGVAAVLGPDYLPGEALPALEAEAVAVIENALVRDPLREGVAREEVRSKLAYNLTPDGCAALLGRLVKAGRLEGVAGGFRLAGSRRELSPAHKEALAALDEVFRKGSPLQSRDEVEQSLSRYAEGANILKYALARGRVVLLPELVLATSAYVEERKQELLAYLREKGTVRAAEYKDVLGLSRKNATALLDYFYEWGLTIREAGTHRLAPKYSNGT